MSRTITVRAMLYWILLVALIMPYVVALLPRKHNPLIYFSVSVSEVESWLQEIDPSVSLSYSLGESETDDGYSYKLIGLGTGKAAKSDQLMSHLKAKIEQKFESQLWGQSGGAQGSSAFHYHLQRFHSNCHLYCFASGVDRENLEYLEQTEQDGFTLTIIVICYTR